MSKTVHSDLSIALTKSLDKKEKQAFGIFITPQTIIKKLVDAVVECADKNNLTIKTILEPACGTCEIVSYCDTYFQTNIRIDAIELNPKIFAAIQPLKSTFKNPVTLIHQDFLSYGGDTPQTPNGTVSAKKPAKASGKKPPKASAQLPCGGATPCGGETPCYDLTISNPPYFVCKKEIVPKKYISYISGRPNIFGLFILHQLSMTHVGGIAAFIIPKSFMNSLYYAKIRTHIIETCTIVNIIDFTEDNDFMDTQQATFGLILLKNGVAPPHDTFAGIGNKFVITMPCGGATPVPVPCGGATPVPVPCGGATPECPLVFFTCDAAALTKLFEGSTTLAKLGLKVRTGNIAWNEYKDEMTNEAVNTVLIYDTNITKDHQIKLTTFANTEKGQYIKREGRQETVVVVKRGHGNSKYKLNYALIDLPATSPYLVENHLNEIYSSDTKMTKPKLLALFHKIMKSFENKKTQEFIDLFIGNNGLSKTELETILPIYL